MTTHALPRPVPTATVARLPGYLRELDALVSAGVHQVPSARLAQTCGVSSAQLRRDLSHLGSYGVRGVGYEVSILAREIAHVLGLTRQLSVAIIGMGNLGRALATYGGFAVRGFSLVALLDNDPAVINEQIGCLTVQPMSALPALAAAELSIAVIATPPAAAQLVCDQLVAAGVSSILTFVQVNLTVPPGVVVRQVDLNTELQILAYHQVRKDGRTALEVVG